MKKRIIAVIMISMAVCICACGGSRSTRVKLDPKHPVSISIWHYYNGAQQAAFDELVTRFNDTEGREKGIFVTGHSQGDVNDLEAHVRDSINKEVGSEAVPNIFSSYADTAYEIDKMGQLADISQYLTEEEQAAYVDSYIEEGKIGINNELRIFPIAKSTEIMMINKTDWDVFAAETGTELSLLETKEGLAKAAQCYYEWTDKKTPDIADDGQAFYGRDAVANLFVSGSMQLGTEIFEVHNQQVTLNADKEVMKRIWDYYYTPYIKGYFKSFGRFRSDDLKIGEIIAFTGSTTSSMYFPDEVEKNEENYNIDYLVMPDPLFSGGANYAVQQGAGMVVTKSTPEEEYASVVFLKWFTQKEQNIAFGCASGYLPVIKEAYNKASMDAVITERGLTVSPKTYDTIITAFENSKECTLYTNKAFDGGSAARKVLEYHLQDKAGADREIVVERIAGGMSLEDAAADLLTQAAFEEWYQSFCEALETAVN